MITVLVWIITNFFQDKKAGIYPWPYFFDLLAYTEQSILLFALDITEKELGWSKQERPHAPPDIASYLVLSVVF